MSGFALIKRLFNKVLRKFVQKPRLKAMHLEHSANVIVCHLQTQHRSTQLWK